MVRQFLASILCALLFANCSSNKQEAIEEEPSSDTIKIEEDRTVTETIDSITNEGLMEWASFFKEFSHDLNDFDIIKEQIRFPFISHEDTILEMEDLYLKDYEILLPESFARACAKANEEMSKELNHFETNKLFKFENSDQGLFQLLIEYNTENVTVTHFEHVPNTNEKFEHATYTFEKIDSAYYQTSITE